MKLGDPSFVDDDLSEYQEYMLAPDTGKEVRANISDTKAYLGDHYNPEGFATLDSHGTSHISVADASGLAISLTTTVNLFFGSKVMVPETGVILNDEMNDFSIPGKRNIFGYEPHPANFIRPGKRPMSSMCPTIVEHANGDALLCHWIRRRKSYSHGSNTTTLVCPGSQHVRLHVPRATSISRSIAAG